MSSRSRVGYLVTSLCAAVMGLFAAVAYAAPTGVQWTPDGFQILVNKDVGAERWAITLNLAEASVTGNVFFVDDRSPAFVWCEETGSDFDAAAGELTLHYRCFGSDAALGGFALADWAVIAEDVSLPASFFIPAAETCDLRDAVNGPDGGSASSVWQCTGSAGGFQFQVFGNGTGFSSATGAFEFDVVGQACSFGMLGDGSFLDVEYSPSRDRLTVFEVTAAGGQFIVSECGREAL